MARKSAPVAAKPTDKPASTSAPLTAEEEAVASRREQLYASRRASAHHLGGEAPRPSLAAKRASVAPDAHEGEEGAPAAKPAAPRRSSPLILAAGGLLALALLIAAIMWATSAVQRGSPSGKLRAALLAADIEPPGPGRSAKFASVGAIDAETPKVALELLGDATIASEGSTRSSHTYRELAAELLLAHAAQLKVAPPPAATKLAAEIRAGTAPKPEDWQALQDAWRAWLAEPGRGGK